MRTNFDLESGSTTYVQVKTVVSPDQVIELDEEESMSDQENVPEEERKVRFNPEQHIYLENAKRIKTDAELEEELVFPLENQTDFGRIAAQTAKQVIIQKIREAEKGYLSEKFGDKQGSIISGTVQRVERGTIFVDLGKAEGVIPFGEQIKSERYKTGDRISGYLYSVDEGGRGVFLRISRTHPEFLKRLFEREVPELVDGVIEIKHVAREPGFRSKIAVVSFEDDVDPIGALVGQNGSRVSTVTSELSGERVDIIEWSEDVDDFIKQSLSPAEVLSLEVNEEEKSARVEVSEDQFSLAIGRGGQNVRLAARLTGYKIDIIQIGADGEVIEQESREEREARIAAERAEKSEEKETETVEKASEPETDEVAEAAEESTETTGEENSEDEVVVAAEDAEEKEDAESEVAAEEEEKTEEA